MESDKAAIEAVLQGERDRFAELVERHKRTVYATAWSYLGDADMCEDAAQETFIRAFRYLGSLRDIENFPAWVAKIARNVSTTLLRRRRNELENRRRWQLEQPSPTKVVDTSDEENFQEMLGSSLAELPPQHRESLVLYYIEGNNIAETANLLGISAAAMKTRLHRARQILRGALEQQIEQGLDQLTPRKDFVPSVILLLPAKPLGVVAAGGGVSLFGKIGGWFGGKFSSVTLSLWMLAPLAEFYLLMYWVVRLESAEIVDKPENRFRKTVLRRNMLLVSVMATCAGIYGAFSSASFGPTTLFQTMTIYGAWGTYNTTRTLRWNRSYFTQGQVLGSFVLVTCLALIGFLDASFTLFVGGMLVMNVLQLLTRHQMPRRLDYSLLLRQANGTLGDVEHEPSASRLVTEAELRGFARFLGEQWLVCDFSIRKSSMLLRLPRVRMSVIDSFLMVTAGNSTIRIESTGQCRTHLSRSDAKAIEALTGVPAAEKRLEQDVSRIVRSCLAYFLRGERAAARALLSTVKDEEIFVNTNVRKTKAYRFLVGVVVVSGIVWAIVAWADYIK